MAARNPGPIIQQTPIGFASFCNHMVRDWATRAVFYESEVNTRVYKNVYANCGVKGPIKINKNVGRCRIKLRDITNGNPRALYRYTHMTKHGFAQTWREGWLQKYGYFAHTSH
eukprot:Platyproteum_vivax@DN2387_c0_g1_i1.p1